MNPTPISELRLRLGSAAAFACALALGALVAGCGGGGDGAGTNQQGSVSTQVVSGVAATGAPLAGEVTLRDASPEYREKVVVIAGDGGFSVDVSDMRAPYVLRAVGAAEGRRHALYSLADAPGIANINPLTSAALANAAGVDDPADVFEGRDPARLERARLGMPAAIAALGLKLRPLMEVFEVAGRDPHRQRFRADHDGLDGMLDSVRIVISGGMLTITNVTSGAVIFSGHLRDFASAYFTSNPEHLPKRGPRLAAPTGVTALGGDGQVTISWDPVENATSYDLFYMERGAVAAALRLDDDDEDDEEEFEDEYEDEEEYEHDRNARWIMNVTSPYVLTGLAPDATYGLMVRARDNPRRGPPSAMVFATTSGSAGVPALPQAPTGVTATGGTRQVSVDWAPVTGATSYNLYWSATDGVPPAGRTMVTGASRPAVLTGLADGVTYYAFVTAVNGAGEGARSVQVAATTLPAAPPPATAPAAPVGVAALGGDGQVTLTWPAVSGATSYNIYWSDMTGVTPLSGELIAAATSPYVHSGRMASTTYYYVVTAVNSVGPSLPSAQVSATTNAPPPAVPAAPSGIMATGGSNQVTVSWNPVSGATSYNLYWSTTLGVTPATGTKVAGATSPYVHTGLADGTAYYYVVTAANGTVEGPASAQATATTQTAPPPLIDGAALYTTYCAGCHGALPGEYQGASAQLITSGIAGVGAMRTRFNPTSGSLIQLTPEQIAAIAAAMQ